MAFWSEPALDPKRQFKFKVTFGYLDGANNAAVFLAQSADRPQWTVSDGTKVDYLDKSFHFPGKVTWNQVKIKFVDAKVVTGGGGTDVVNVAQSSYDYLTKAGFVSPELAGPAVQAANIATVGKYKAVTRAQNISIDVLESTGRTIDTWTLRNAWVTTVALNNLDYSAEGVLTAEYTFRYDWADFDTNQRNTV